MMTERAIDAIWEEVLNFDPEKNIVVLTMHMKDLEDELTTACEALPWYSTTGPKSSAALIAMPNTIQIEHILRGRNVNHLHAEIDLYGTTTFYCLNLSGPSSRGMASDILIPVVNMDSNVRGKARVVQFGRN